MAKRNVADPKPKRQRKPKAQPAPVQLARVIPFKEKPRYHPNPTAQVAIGLEDDANRDWDAAQAAYNEFYAKTGSTSKEELERVDNKLERALRSCLATKVSFEGHLGGLYPISAINARHSAVLSERLLKLSKWRFHVQNHLAVFAPAAQVYDLAVFRALRRRQERRLAKGAK
jgi:hypothetical protein